MTIGLRAVLIGKMPNQIPKIRGSTTVLEVRYNFSRGGAPQTHWDTLPRPCSPQSPQCLDQCRAFDASNAQGLIFLKNVQARTMEGPERSAGAPRGVGSGEGRRSPSPVWGSGGYAPRKIFQKSTLKSRIFRHFLSGNPKWSLLQWSQARIRQ